MKQSRAPFLASTLAALALFLTGCASGGSSSEGGDMAPSPAPASTEEAGAALFTAAQAERGGEVYQEVCLECHTRVEFSESAFLFAWEGASVNRLLTYIRENMPDESPGSLPSADYLAVTAYILQMNGWPAGEVEMVDDEERLRAIVFEARGTSDP